ncbi:MAG: hypothetical protein P4L81_02330 [Candidatus Pacebacteria bacterium]|nr:hypothetical protein [Candidatus Paceibacterota bacterium]
MNRKKGFTLLLAALVASIAVTLGSSIYSIVSKELKLSSIGQDSQFAFYAADTVAECALFWDSRSDLHPSSFATSTASQGSVSSITCDGPNNAPVTIAAASANSATSTIGPSGGSIGFDIFNDHPGGYCANATISKTLVANGTEQTVIVANGFNVSCSAIGSAPDALERTVELKY